MEAKSTVANRKNTRPSFVGSPDVRRLRNGKNAMLTQKLTTPEVIAREFKEVGQEISLQLSERPTDDNAETACERYKPSEVVS